MNSSDPIESDSLLEETAAEWLVERAEGFAPGRAEAFVEWCNQDQRHANAASRVKQTLLLLDEMPLMRNRMEQRFGRVQAEQVAAKVTGWRPIAYWMAGIAAVLLFSIMAWHSFAPSSATATRISTAMVPQRVALSDGSVIDLNAHSNVQVALTKASRRVTLITGEGYFRVAHDPSRPFIVTANGVAVRAVGTAFNVKLVGDKVDVLVMEGRVEVDHTGASNKHVKPIIPVLTVGELTQISPAIDATPHIEEVAPESVRALLSWQDRMTSFTNVPLREMVARLNRCNSTKLVLDDPTLGERRIGGVIDLSQVNAFVKMLEQDGDIVAERRSDSEIILRRAH